MKYYVIIENGKDKNTLEIILRENAEPQFITALSFSKVTAEEVVRKREMGIPCFLFKQDSNLYLATLPEYYYANSTSSRHICATAGQECKRLSAAPGEKGCEKVRNGAQYLERYDWIKIGYETFNTTVHDVFIVKECAHYKKCPPKEKKASTDNKNISRNKGILY